MKRKNKMYLGYGLLAVILISVFIFAGTQQLQYSRSNIVGTLTYHEVKYSIGTGSTYSTCPSATIPYYDISPNTVASRTCTVEGGLTCSNGATGTLVTLTDTSKCEGGTTKDAYTDLHIGYVTVRQNFVATTCSYNGVTYQTGDMWCSDAGHVAKCYSAGQTGIAQWCTNGCTNAVCNAPVAVCEDGDLRCYNNARQYCSSGQWNTLNVCPTGTTCECTQTGTCNPGCIAITDPIQTVCTDGTKRCNNNNLEVCSNNQWIVNDVCTATEVCQITTPYCKSTIPEQVCEPLSTVSSGCENNVITIVKCNADGTATTAIDTVCQLGTTCKEWIFNSGSTWTCSSDTVNPPENEDGGAVDSQCVDKPLQPCLKAVWYDYPTCDWTVTACDICELNPSDTSCKNEDGSQKTPEQVCDEYATKSPDLIYYDDAVERCACNQGYQYNGEDECVKQELITEELQKLVDEHPEYIGYIIGGIVVLGIIIYLIPKKKRR